MIQTQNPSSIHYTILGVLIDVLYHCMCSVVILFVCWIFVGVVFFFVADTLYRLCLLCMPFIVVNNNNNMHANSLAPPPLKYTVGARPIC